MSVESTISTIPLFEITGVLFPSADAEDSAGHDSGATLERLGERIPVAVGRKVIRFGGRPPETLTGGHTPPRSAAVAAIGLDRLCRFLIVLCFFEAFLFNFCRTYNSKTLASSREVNWERMFLVFAVMEDNRLM
jgi:hypothetical protein